jgi:ATP dependent DNA ligase domain
VPPWGGTGIEPVQGHRLALKGQPSRCPFVDGSGWRLKNPHMRVLAFIEPCLPSPDRPPFGADWIHEIKLDGFRMMVRRDGASVRLLTRKGYDWTGRFPLIAAAAEALRAWSFLIDGEAVACDGDGLPGVRPAALSAAGRARVSVCLRLARAQRPGHAARTARGAQARLGGGPAEEGGCGPSVLWALVRSVSRCFTKCGFA